MKILLIIFGFLIRSIMIFYEGFKENELSDVKIEEILDKMKVYDFNGIYARDELTKDEMEKGFYIFNLDDSEGAGSHWVAVYYDNVFPSIYCDSYGFVPPIEIESLITPYIYNKKQIQDLNSSSCGYFSLSFIDFINDNKRRNVYHTFEAFINIFDDKDTKKNEDLLFNLLAITSKIT